MGRLDNSQCVNLKSIKIYSTCRHLEPPWRQLRINNGGIGFRGLGEETEIEIDQMVMNVDYFSGVVLTKSLLPDSWRSVG